LQTTPSNPLDIETPASIARWQGARPIHSRPVRPDGSQLLQPAWSVGGGAGAGRCLLLLQHNPGRRRAGGSSLSRCLRILLAGRRSVRPPTAAGHCSGGQQAGLRKRPEQPAPCDCLQHGSDYSIKALHIIVRVTSSCPIR